MFTDDGRIWGVMQQTAKHGGIAMVHCEDDCIIDFCVHKLYREGRQQAEHIHEARPSLCEEAAIMRMLLLARRSEFPLYIVHVSSIEGIEAIAEARGKRLPVYGESLHNYLAFCDEDYAKPDSMIYHNYPALKSAKDRAALWEALRSGVLDVASSDDFTIPFAQKISGKEVDNAPAATTASRRGWLTCSPKGSRSGSSASTALSTCRRPRSPSCSASIRAKAPSRSAATPTSSSSIPISGAR